MKQSDVIKPKDDEGLALGSLELKNWALLAKWFWRFRKEKEALWRKVIVAKYGVEEGGWVPRRVPS